MSRDDVLPALVGACSSYPGSAQALTVRPEDGEYGRVGGFAASSCTSSMRVTTNCFPGGVRCRGAEPDWRGLRKRRQLVIDAIVGGLRPYGSGPSHPYVLSGMAAKRQKLGQRRARGSLPDSSSIATHPGRRSTSSSREPIPGECWPTSISIPATAARPWASAIVARPVRIDLGFDAAADYTPSTGGRTAWPGW